MIEQKNSDVTITSINGEKFNNLGNDITAVEDGAKVWVFVSDLGAKKFIKFELVGDCLVFVLKIDQEISHFDFTYLYIFYFK